MQTTDLAEFTSIAVEFTLHGAKPKMFARAAGNDKERVLLVVYDMCTTARSLTFVVVVGCSINESATGYCCQWGISLVCSAAASH